MIKNTQPSVSAMLILVLSGISSTAIAGLFQPDGATASSEFSSSYIAENTINGTGLPAGFTTSDAHDDYSRGNHWTTSGSDSTRSITWTFNTPATLGQIILWNHRSNIIASNSGYEPINFDLLLSGAGIGADVLVLDDAPLMPDVATGQTIGLGSVFEDVTSVTFVVNETQNPATPFTGLAEVAFTAIPEPTAVVLLGAASVALIVWRRRI